MKATYRTFFGLQKEPFGSDLPLEDILLTAALSEVNQRVEYIYTRSWTISDLGVGARAITVTVQWNRMGRERRVEVSSNTKGNGV